MKRPSWLSTLKKSKCVTPKNEKYLSLKVLKMLSIKHLLLTVSKRNRNVITRLEGGRSLRPKVQGPARPSTYGFCVFVGTGLSRPHRIYWLLKIYRSLSFVDFLFWSNIISEMRYSRGRGAAGFSECINFSAVHSWQGHLSCGWQMNSYHCQYLTHSDVHIGCFLLATVAVK